MPNVNKEERLRNAIRDARIASKKSWYINIYDFSLDNGRLKLLVDEIERLYRQKAREENPCMEK